MSAVTESLGQVMAVGVVRAAPGPDQPGAALDEVTLFTRARLHMSRVMRSRPGEGMVLFAGLDRVNPALAFLPLSRLAPAALA